MELKEARNSIDFLDEHLISLLQKRFLLAKELKNIKKENKVEMVDEGRENEVIAHVLSINKNVFPPEILKKIYYLIFNASYAAQDIKPHDK